MTPQIRNADGSLSPAPLIGWQEEHGRFARFVFWLRRIEHCNDREGASTATRPVAATPPVGGGQ